ncbi:tetratricopeptide repeat-containing sensor histidine kinase [Emticicia sp. BO119]|uniref:tetratricopeptide repeat-containing sensor histidine kinase n=1 Tax=Emticicia sp. BO119 TaxID=2757768 RepID=UPI0015F03B42|nr:tetratricopeptide repeat-containing sensor histidine kinase [Emticicia sp. BO119]MBA4853234.1 tetratricopeptide repeat protein [Emticicia sp. BO119]
MKKYTFFYVSLLLSINSFCQQVNIPKADSLKRILTRLPAEGKSFANDTTRVRMLFEVGEEALNANADSAVLLVKQTLAFSQKINYKKGSLKGNIMLAQYYRNQSLRASEYLFKALHIAEELKSYSDLIKIYNLIAYNYSKLNDLNNALKYYQLHSGLCNKYGNKEDYLMSLNYIAITYFKFNNYKKTLEYLTNCERANDSLRSNKVATATLINIAKVYIKTKQYDLALNRLQRAINVEDGYKDRIAYTAHEIAQIYLLQGNLSDALLWAQKAYAYSNGVGKFLVAEIAKTVSDIYLKLNRKDLAFTYLNTYIHAKLDEDSIKNSQLNRFIILDYEAEKQQQKIQELNISTVKQRNQNTILLIVVITTMIIIGVILLFYRSLFYKNKQIYTQKTIIENFNKDLEIKVQERTQELSEANDELIRKNEEILDALFKGQSIERKRVAVELHDNLGGTLSAIKWRLEALNGSNLTEKERKIYDGILSMMKNAYAEVRLISHNMLPAEFEEKGLLEAIRKLCKDVNQSEKLHIDLISEGDIQRIDKRMALELYSICMELINNILKHSEANKAEISLEVSLQNIILSIRDNGKGISDSSTTNGVGLKNLKTRLETINGKVNFNSSDAWRTEITIEINY